MISDSIFFFVINKALRNWELNYGEENAGMSQ